MDELVEPMVTCYLRETCVSDRQIIDSAEGDCRDDADDLCWWKDSSRTNYLASTASRACMQKEPGELLEQN